MKRRDFSLSATALALPVVSAPAWAQGAAPKQGKDYIKLSKPAPIEAPKGKIDVVEFFWYNCPHCHQFEPALATWMKTAPKDLAVRRVPVAFNASFAPQQKLYYALEGMGQLDALHAKVFHAIHVEKQRLSKEDEIFAWVGKQGVDMAKFKEFFNSFGVANKVRRATDLQNAYGVEGVPSMGVSGLYYTDGTMAGGMDGVLRVVEHVAGLARKG